MFSIAVIQLCFWLDGPTEPPSCMVMEREDLSHKSPVFETYIQCQMAIPGLVVAMGQKFQNDLEMTKGKPGSIRAACGPHVEDAPDGDIPLG